MAKDPRYKSGEHAVPDDGESTSNLEQLQTNGIVVAEIRNIRREMKAEFVHVNNRINEFGGWLKETSDKLNDHKQEDAAVATTVTALNGSVSDLGKRLGRVERGEGSGNQVATQAIGAASGTSWKTQIAKNTAIPWVIASLLGLAMILAAITGRGASSFSPYQPDHPILTNPKP